MIEYVDLKTMSTQPGNNITVEHDQNNGVFTIKDRGVVVGEVIFDGTELVSHVPFHPRYDCYLEWVEKQADRVNSIRRGQKYGLPTKRFCL